MTMAPIVLLGVLIATILGLSLCLWRGIVGAGDGAGSALAGGIGAGLGVTWKFILGLDDVGVLVDVLSMAAGILATFGALHYGRRIRRLRAEAAARPETFE